MKDRWMLYPYWTYVDMIGVLLLLCLTGLGAWWFMPIPELLAVAITALAVAASVVLNVRSNLKFVRENPPCATCLSFHSQEPRNTGDGKYSAWSNAYHLHIREEHPELLRYEARNG